MATLSTSGAEEQINDSDESDSSDQRAREIFLRVFDFGADQVQVFPAIVGPECSRQRGKKSAEDGASAHSCIRPKRLGPACLGTGGRKKCHANYDRDGGDLDGGQENLDRAS